MSQPDLSTVIITVDDLLTHHCAWGIRRYWRNHGLDFPDFLKNGIPAERFIAAGDDLARQAVERKLGGAR